MSTATFIQRIDYGRQAEQEFISYLMSKNTSYFKTGQEWWMPRWIHDKLRHVLNDDSIRLLRHFPDFSVFINGKYFLVQVKAAPTSRNYPTVTIERDSFDCSKKLCSLGLPVLLVWLIEDGTLLAQWTDRINPEMPNTPREETNGSHTPQYNIRKKELRPISEFV